MGLNEAQTYKETYRIIDLSFVIVPVSLIEILAFLGIQPPFPSNIFENLIQVIAILFGFSIVAVFYYLGKADEYQRDYIHALYTASTHLKQAKSKTVEGEEAKQKLEKQISEFRILSDVIPELYNELRGIIISWGKPAMVGFGSGLVVSFIALGSTAMGIEKFQLSLLIIAVSIVLYGLFCFVQIWYKLQDLLNDLLRHMKNLYDIAVESL